MRKTKSNKVSIYLIKKDVDYKDILRGDQELAVLNSGNNWETYYLPSSNTMPDWLTNFFHLNRSDISNANAKVISLHRIMINNKEVVFAIPFGSGKYLMNDNVAEEQFGLKVLLNSVSRDGFRQLVTVNYGGDYRTKAEQLPKKTDIYQFGFDIDRDLVRKATAKSENKVFNNNTIVGGDLLSVSVNVDIDSIDDFLKSCYKLYKSNTYKTNFAWLDQIKEVKDKTLKKNLDEKLIKKINKYDYDYLWAAVPEVINWEEVGCFCYGNNRIKEYDDIYLEKIVDSYKGKDISIERLSGELITALDINKTNILYSWNLYKCLITEIKYNKNIYCLSFGKWYKINKSFVEDTNNYYKRIKICKTKFIDANNEREDEYNNKLHSYLKGSIILDKILVDTGDKQKNFIEVCDVLSRNKQLIHVKKGGSSSKLSHLFNQASVSGDMLLNSEFRNKANERIGRKVFSSYYSSNDYTIVLAIITNRNDKLPRIPFFSKVSIRYAINNLKKLGYSVEIKNIFNKND